MRKVRVLLLGSLALVGCPSEPKSTTKIAPAAVDKTDAAVAQQAPSPPPAAEHPSLVEVEIIGTLVPPPKVKTKGTLMVYVADNDCLADDANMLGSLPAGEDGHFFIEVFPKWGKEITICGALLEAPGKPARIYGKLPEKHRAEGLGEVVLKDLVIELKQGPPHTFPAPAVPK